MRVRDFGGYVRDGADLLFRTAPHQDARLFVIEGSDLPFDV